MPYAPATEDEVIECKVCEDELGKLTKSEGEELERYRNEPIHEPIPKRGGIASITVVTSTKKTNMNNSSSNVLHKSI